MGKKHRYKSYAWVHPRTKKLYARVQIKQADGSYKTYLKPALNKKHADQLANEMFDDYAVRKTGFIEGESMTFDNLADWYEEHIAIPPVYSDEGTRVAGMRTYKTVRRRLKFLKQYFGKILIKNINDEILLRFKKIRLKDSVSVAAVNRDLEILRAMFRIAVRRRWLRESPFDFGERLIEKSLEKKRERILTPAEETAILHYARKSEKSLIYYVLICLLDCGARPSEIYDASTEKAEPVTWNSFLEFNFKAVKLISYKGRKKMVRIAPVTSRLESAMRELWENTKKQIPENQIFEVKSFKTAWRNIIKNSEIALKISKSLNVPLQTVLLDTIDDEKYRELYNKFKKEPSNLDIRIRDLRRNLGTRLANLGMENDLRQRLLGHNQSQTTFDYTQTDLQTALYAKQMLDSEIENRVLDSDILH